MVLIIPTVFSCCWYCSTQIIKEKVDKLLEDKLPNPKAWQLAQDTMLFPLLRRIAALDARLPTQWIDCPQLPQCPPGVENESHRTQRMLQCRFWEMCRMARLDFQAYKSTCDKPCDVSFFHVFVSLAKSVMDLITPDDDSYKPIYNQIKLVGNDDVYLRMVTHTASMSMRMVTNTVKLEVCLIYFCKFIHCVNH